MTCCGSLARRWIRASVCSTESCSRAAMSARSSARILAWRSTTRSRAMRSHHGPSTTTIAAITSSTPPSGRSTAKLSCADVSVARPLISSTPATDMRTTVRRRPLPPVRPASGSARCRIVSCSSARGVPPDQHEAGRADDQRPAQPAEPADAERAGQSSTTASSDASPAASVIPCRSDLALAGDVAVRAVHRQQQPGQHVGRQREAAGDQRGQHERDPDDGGVEAGACRQAGRDAAGQAVVPRSSQRAAAGRSPQP